MKKKLLISGEVHDVGYRPFLLGIAESLEIERFFADNTKINGSKAVYVLVDSSPEKVESFIEIVKTKHPENARVEKITIEDYKGNVMKTENYYRYLSAMQLSKIATYGGKMLEKQDETIAEIRNVREEVREVKERVDEVKEEVKKVREEVREVKEEVINVREEVREVKEEIGEVKEEVKNLREEVREVKEEVKNVREEVAGVSSRLDKTNNLLEERFNRMEKEIERIKKALIRAGIEV